LPEPPFDRPYDWTVSGDPTLMSRTFGYFAPTDLIARAHARGLLVHTWTFRNDSMPSDASYMGNPVFEYLKFYELGIDGVFSDFADTAFAARELFRLR
jgi:glycerophosphoryl diester phosphodiesterase